MRSSAGRGAPDPSFGTAQLFFADSRLAFALLNSARYPIVKRLLGVSREQANIVSVFLALLAADAAYETARWVVRAPLRVSGADVVLAGGAVREAAFGVTGARSRDVSLFGTTVVGAYVASVALTRLRRVTHTLRAAEERVRRRRIGRYREAIRAAGA
jgi:hypothetical protein